MISSRGSIRRNTRRADRVGSDPGRSSSVAFRSSRVSIATIPELKTPDSTSWNAGSGEQGSMIPKTDGGTESIPLTTGIRATVRSRQSLMIPISMVKVVSPANAKQTSMSRLSPGCSTSGSMPPTETPGTVGEILRASILWGKPP